MPATHNSSSFPLARRSNPDQDAIGMAECWASLVSSCSGGRSAEHVFTRGLFLQKEQLLYGMPWLKGESRVMSIDSVTTNCLCRKHNSAMSNSVDQAAIDVNNVRRELHAIGEFRAGITGKAGKKRAWSRVRFRLDGVGLERWCLKTTCTMAYAQRSEANGWTPTPEVVRAAFGVERLPEGVGLALFADVGDSLNLRDTVAFAFLRNKATQEVGGSLFNLGGLSMICTWDRSPEEFLPIPMLNAAGQHVLHHLNKLERQPENVVVEFDWTGGHRNDRDKEIVRLRTKYKSPPR